MSLPSGYTKLKYVRSTGAQAIFTGVSADQDTRVVIDFQMTSGKTTEQHICSVRTSTSGPFFTAFYNGGLSRGNYKVRWASQAIKSFAMISGTDRMVLDFNKNSVTLGDHQLTFSSATFSIAYPLTLFCRNTAGTCDAYAYMDMYSCQIYSGSTLARDYIPCKNSSGVAGLWDDVESMFYGSSTPLEAGPEDTSAGSHSTLIDGTKYSILGGRTLIGGTGYGISKGRTLIDGTGYDIAFGSATENALRDFIPGSIVKLNEIGSPVEFYVAKHDYEAKLNGMGRTLLVRKDSCGQRVWNSSGNNYYGDSTVDTWLNNDYKNMLDSGIQTAIAQTSFLYTPGGYDTVVTSLMRPVFLLSLAELGATADNSNSEGSELPIASTLRTIPQWTRTPYTGMTIYVWGISDTGNPCMIGPTLSTPCNPAFTLPGTILVDADNNVIV